MEKLNSRTGKCLGAYAIVLGVGYVATAVAEASGCQMFPGRTLNIAVLLVISATYLAGVKGLMAGRTEGISFLMGGVLLSCAIGGLDMLIMGADGLMYLLGETDGFVVISKTSPSILLLALALPLLPVLRNLTRGMSW
ncbi:MAG: hypothetical protein ABC588_04150 [Candidatus Methanosuratincola petrocarbonis]